MMVPFQGPRNDRRGSPRFTRTALLGLLAAVLSLVVAAGPSSATEEIPPEGWARVAHLSPDTTSVDVALTAIASGETLFELDDVAYGDVSTYWRLPVGTYLVAMTPSGSASDAVPAISELIRIKENQPTTLAVLGSNADLTTRSIDDDLTPPSDGEARVRILQASTVADSVDITTATGTPVASEAGQGEVTGYATVPAGPWELELADGTTTSAAEVDLGSGSINTLLVLDNAAGGLTIKAIEDSVAVSDTPVGGTNTGAAPGGAAATADAQVPGEDATMGLILLAAAAALVAFVTGRNSRRSATATDLSR